MLAGQSDIFADMADFPALLEATSQPEQASADLPAMPDLNNASEALQVPQMLSSTTQIEVDEATEVSVIRGNALPPDGTQLPLMPVAPMEAPIGVKAPDGQTSTPANSVSPLVTNPAPVEQPTHFALARLPVTDDVASQAGAAPTSSGQNVTVTAVGEVRVAPAERVDGLAGQIAATPQTFQESVSEGQLQEITRLHPSVAAEPPLLKRNDAIVESRADVSTRETERFDAGSAPRQSDRQPQQQTQSRTQPQADDISWLPLVQSLRPASPIHSTEHPTRATILETKADRTPVRGNVKAGSSAGNAPELAAVDLISQSRLHRPVAAAVPAPIEEAIEEKTPRPIAKADPARIVSRAGEQPAPSPTASTQPVAPQPVFNAQPIAAQPAPIAPTIPVAAPVAELRPSQPLEAMIDSLMEARDVGRSARPELTLRHQEFGSINMRLEATGTDLRATLASRDPAFIPAIQAALVDRAVAASSESASSQSNRGGDQSSQNNASSGSFAGSNTSSERGYGSSTGSGQASSQPYSEQMGRSEDDRADQDRSPSAIADGDRPSGTGLFA